MVGVTYADPDGQAIIWHRAYAPAVGSTRACPDCERPQHYTGAELGWCHDAAVDTWDCADPRKAGA